MCIYFDSGTGGCFPCITTSTSCPASPTNWPLLHSKHCTARACYVSTRSVPPTTPPWTSSTCTPLAVAAQHCCLWRSTGSLHSLCSSRCLTSPTLRSCGAVQPFTFISSLHFQPLFTFISSQHVHLFHRNIALCAHKQTHMTLLLLQASIPRTARLRCRASGDIQL